MIKHSVYGSIVDEDRPLAMIEVSGGNGTVKHVIAGAVIDVDRPLAVRVISTGVKTARKFQYDFSIDGGGQGTIALRDVDNVGALPANFIVQSAELDIITPLTSLGSATGALTTGQGAGDLVVATVVAGAPWSSTGSKVTIPLFGTIGTRIKITAIRSPALVVAAANLNAGKFNLWIEGVQSDA